MKKLVIYKDTKSTVEIKDVTLSMNVGIVFNGERYALVQVGSAFEPKAYVGRMASSLVVHDTPVYISYKNTTKDLQCWLTTCDIKAYVFDTKKELMCWVVDGR